MNFIGISFIPLHTKPKKKDVDCLFQLYYSFFCAFNFPSSFPSLLFMMYEWIKNKPVHRVLKLSVYFFPLLSLFGFTLICVWGFITWNEMRTQGKHFYTHQMKNYFSSFFASLLLWLTDWLTFLCVNLYVYVLLCWHVYQNLAIKFVECLTFHRLECLCT